MTPKDNGRDIKAGRMTRRNKGMKVTKTRWHPRQQQLREFLRRQIETHIHRIEARKEE
jgi:hypothetical protein